MLECINDVTYRIQKSTGAKPRIVHYNRLKPYLGDDDLRWWRSANTGHPVIEENGEPRPTGPAPTLPHSRWRPRLKHP